MKFQLRTFIKGLENYERYVSNNRRANKNMAILPAFILRTF